MISITTRNSTSTNCTVITLDGVDNSFKQATKGDCNVGRPGGWNLKDQLKWDSWNSVRGMPGHEAKERYVDLVKHFFSEQGADF